METAIIVMSKVPLPGVSKTRLNSVLSAQECVDLHRACLYDLGQNIDKLGWPTYLYYTGGSELDDYSDNRWWGLENKLYERILIRPQQGQDLGERMYQAAREVLSVQESIILLGSDLPDLACEVLEETRQNLLNNDVIIGPAEDGGYYLLAIKQAHLALFQGITWGSSQVLEETLARIELQALHYKVLATARDIDTWEDLQAYHRRSQLNSELQPLTSYQIADRFLKQYLDPERSKINDRQG